MSKKSYICRFLVAYRHSAFRVDTCSTQLARNCYWLALVVPGTKRKTICKITRATPDPTSIGILGCRRFSSFHCPMRVLFAHASD
jgi:hypothetical protein